MKKNVIATASVGKIQFKPYREYKALQIVMKLLEKKMINPKNSEQVIEIIKALIEE